MPERSRRRGRTAVVVVAVVFTMGGALFAARRWLGVDPPVEPTSRSVRLGWSAPDPNRTCAFDLVSDDGAPLHFDLTFDPAATPWQSTSPMTGRATRTTTSGREVSRKIWADPHGRSPAAPDAACRAEPLDELEHLLALGWPTLPNRRVAVGESWIGPSPSGLCAELACFAPTGEADGRPCVAPPWRYTLDAVDEREGHEVAVVTGRWADGGSGAHAASRIEIDLQRGQPISSVTEVNPPPKRTLGDARPTGAARPPVRTVITRGQCRP